MRSIIIVDPYYFLSVSEVVKIDSEDKKRQEAIKAITEYLEGKITREKLEKKLKEANLTRP